MSPVLKLRRFAQPYWRPSLAALGLLTAVVLMDLALPRLVQRIIDQGIAGGDLPLIGQTTLIMLALSVLSTLFALGNNALSVRVGESVARDLRQALFVHIQALAFGDLDRLNTGQLMVRLSSDATVVQRLVQVFLRIGTRAPLLMAGSLMLMFSTDSRLALIMLPILLATGGLIIVFVSRMGPLFLTVQQQLDWLNTVLQENIAGVRVVKAFVGEAHEGRRFAEANQAFADRSVRVMRFMASMSPALSLLVNLGIVTVIWAGGGQAIRGEVTVGQIVAFANYLQTTMGPLLIMVMLANVVAAGTASAQRVVEVLETIPEVQDAPGARRLPAGISPRVEFQGVSFHYNGAADEPVLHDVSLQALPGQTVAILGATGSGKSTLVNLIPRFYDVSAGRVLIDGLDVRSLAQDTLLARIGVVPQETVLFAGTVRDNIRYGRPQAGEAEVLAAARAAQAHDFILQLPQGYDTRVEQRGVNLSGGQKQRLAIARALLTRPDILILDDSTSSVDVETEVRLQAELAEWMRGRTCFVVAQRISTVLTADKIVVIDDGRLVAQGTHPELMQSSPIYQEIFASQLGAGLRQE